jgi:hypothetical protein
VTGNSPEVLWWNQPTRPVDILRRNNRIIYNSMVDSNSEQPQQSVDEELRRRDAIYACCQQLRQQQHWSIEATENMEKEEVAKQVRDQLCRLSC